MAKPVALIRALLDNGRPTCTLLWFMLSLFGLLVAYSVFGIAMDVPLVSEALLLSLFFCFYSFTSNNYFDRKGDAANPSKIAHNPVASGRLTVAQCAAENIFLVVSMFLFAWLWFPSLLPLLAVFIANMTFYSLFKRMPVADLLSHGFGVASIFLIPALAVGSPVMLAVWAVLAVMGGSNVIELDNQIGDYAADKAAGFRTTTVRFGTAAARRLMFLSLLLHVAAIVALYLWTAKWYLLILAFLPVPHAVSQVSASVLKRRDRLFLLVVVAFALAALLSGWPIFS